MSTLQSSRPVPTSATPGLEASRRWCERITRRAAKNFYYGLRLLPEPRRSGMYALYAYMRAIDDVADEAPSGGESRALRELDRWRALTHRALESGEPPDDSPLWPAFIDMAARSATPVRLFDDAIDGQARDLTGGAFATFAELDAYCYRVAGTVGLASTMIFGNLGGDAALDLAVKRGIAFQLTNVLRDVNEDAGRGRCYLPADELAAAGVAADELLVPERRAGVVGVLRTLAERAEGYYRVSEPLDGWIENESRPTLRAMTRIYRSILDRIVADPERVLRERVSLSLAAKLRIAWDAARGR